MLPLTFLASSIVQTPLCGYSTKVQLTIAPSLSLLSSTTTSVGDLTISIQNSNDRSLVGTYQLTVIPFINSYSYTQPSASSIITLKVIEPCLKTKINDLNVEDMVAFATYSQTSKITYNFTDSIDLSESTLDYCGTK